MLKRFFATCRRLLLPWALSPPQLSPLVSVMPRLPFAFMLPTKHQLHTLVKPFPPPFLTPQQAKTLLPPIIDLANKVEQLEANYEQHRKSLKSIEQSQDRVKAKLNANASSLTRMQTTLQHHEEMIAEIDAQIVRLGLQAELEAAQQAMSQMANIPTDQLAQLAFSSVALTSMAKVETFEAKPLSPVANTETSASESLPPAISFTSLAKVEPFKAKPINSRANLSCIFSTLINPSPSPKLPLHLTLKSTPKPSKLILPHQLVSKATPIHSPLTQFAMLSRSSFPSLSNSLPSFSLLASMPPNNPLVFPRPL